MGFLNKNTLSGGKKKVDLSMGICLLIVLHWVSHCFHQNISIQNDDRERICGREIDTYLKRKLKQQNI